MQRFTIDLDVKNYCKKHNSNRIDREEIQETVLLLMPMSNKLYQKDRLNKSQYSILIVLAYSYSGCVSPPLNKTSLQWQTGNYDLC